MSEKPFQCTICKKSFATKKARNNHRKDAHYKLRKSDYKQDWTGIPRSVRADIAMEAFDDLPDGAFFQAAKDTFGIEPGDFA